MQINLIQDFIKYYSPNKRFALPNKQMEYKLNWPLDNYNYKSESNSGDR